MKKYHVVKIIDEYKIVISAGSDDGIQQGDSFYVLGKETQELIDPVTNESLGYIGAKKDIVCAFEVKPKYSICENAKKTVAYSSAIEAIKMADLSMLGKSKPVHLNVDIEQISGELDVDNTPIQIGDIVELVEKS